MERLASGDQQELGPDSWQEYVRRVVRYASSPHAYDNSDGHAELHKPLAKDSAGAVDWWDDVLVDEETLSHEAEDAVCAANRLVGEWPIAESHST